MEKGAIIKMVSAIGVAILIFIGTLFVVSIAKRVKNDEVLGCNKLQFKKSDGWGASLCKGKGELSCVIATAKEANQYSSADIATVFHQIKDRMKPYRCDADSIALFLASIHNNEAVICTSDSDTGFLTFISMGVTCSEMNEAESPITSAKYKETVNSELSVYPCGDNYQVPSSFMVNAQSLELWWNPFKKTISKCIGETQAVEIKIIKYARETTITIMIAHIVDLVLLVLMIYYMFRQYSQGAWETEIIFVFVDLLMIGLMIYLYWNFSVGIEVTNESTSAVKLPVRRAKRSTGCQDPINVTIRPLPKRQMTREEVANIMCHPDLGVLLGKREIDFIDIVEKKYSVINKVSSINNHVIFKHCQMNCADYVRIEGKHLCDFAVEAARVLKWSKPLSCTQSYGPLIITSSKIIPKDSNITFTQGGKLIHIDRKGKQLGEAPIGAGIISTQFASTRDLPDITGMLSWGEIDKVGRWIGHVFKQCLGSDTAAHLLLLKYAKYIDWSLIILNLVDIMYTVYSMKVEIASFKNIIFCIKVIRIVMAFGFLVSGIIALLLESTIGGYFDAESSND